MNRQRLFLTIIILSLLINSCVSGNRYKALQQERDSLEVVLNATDSSLNNVISYISQISSSIDSITAQENIILLGVNENGTKFSRKEKQQNIEMLVDLIKRQRETIVNLEHTIEVDDAELSKFHSLLNNLYAQFDKKEQELKALQSENKRNRATINHLNTIVEDLSVKNKDLTEKNAENEEIIEIQNNALTNQDRLLNTGYFLVGTRKELVKQKILGVIGDKLNVSAINLDSFNEIDIRHFNEISISAKKIKLLTPAPASSYDITQNGKETLLTIKDNAAFWSKTSYHIILTF